MEPLVFTETRSFATFFLVLVGGAVAIGAWRLLWPLPLKPKRLALFAGLLWVAALCAWTSANQRIVVLDRVAKQVREGRSFLGLSKLRSRPFADYSAVIVESREGPVTNYVLSLTGANLPPLELGFSPEIRRAENLARGVAAAGGWVAKRRGYRLEVPAPVAGSVQAVQTVRGEKGIAVTLQDVVHIVPAAGEESPL